MTIQAELDALMDEMAVDFMESLDNYSEEIVAKIARIRSNVYDLLADYSRKDDRISKSRINSLLRELDDVEYEVYLELKSEIEQALSKVTEQAEKNTTRALVGLLGMALIFGSKTNKSNVEEVVENTLEYVMNRTIVGENTLSDILRSISGLIREEVQTNIRYGIQRNESISRIGRRVKDAFDKTAWQIKRVVKTELPIAFRKSVSYIGGKLGVIKAVQIIDNRGRHRYHEHHECYRLAEQNMYGWGKGIYRPEDTFIYDPHPQCTAYFRYVLTKEAIADAV